MFDGHRAARELLGLARQPELDAGEYERLAMAVFGEMLAKDEPQQQLWEQRRGGYITFFAYEDGRRVIEENGVAEPCWRRLRRDLLAQNRDAQAGVQLAFSYAREAGLSRNPRWGGERKRDVERIMLRHGVDPNAAPGLQTDGPEEGTASRQRPEEYLGPAVANRDIQQLAIDERLGIADFWIALPDEERHLVNAMLDGLEPEKKLALLEELAVEQISDYVANQDIPRPSSGWATVFSDDLQDAIARLPARSQRILGFRYEDLVRNDRTRARVMHAALAERRGRGGEVLLRKLMSETCSLGDSLGAKYNFQIGLDTGTSSFEGFLRLTENTVPEVARRERQLASEHRREAQWELVDALRRIQADPGLQHIADRYAEVWEIYNRNDGQRALATARGFGNAAADTVEGIVTLLTTDPSKTAAGIYHLVQHPELLVVALDDAMVDEDEFAGAILFEMAMAACGAGPASKATQVQKAARLAALAEEAAKAGKLRAAQRLADKAAEILDDTRGGRSTVEQGEADVALRRARDAIDANASAADAAQTAGDAAELAVLADLPENLADLERLPPGAPYRKLAQLQRYLEARGVELAYGDRGAEILDALGETEALGAFIVERTPPSGAAPRTAIVFRGHPTTRVVHHELWHRQDFLTNYSGDASRWAASEGLTRERYVHRRLTEGDRAGVRWGTYSTRDQRGQVLYMRDLENSAVLSEVQEALRSLGITLDPARMPSRAAARAALGSRVAAWVRTDARAPLQKAADLGPNRWAAMPNRPTGERFQRGLSGDHGGGAGGFDEARRLLAGETDRRPRAVSTIGENTPPGETTQHVTAQYSDPMSIRGRSDRLDRSGGRDPDREALLSDLSLDDVEAIGFFPNRTSPWVWAQNYKRLLEQAGVTPTPGSRGARFLEELDAALGRAEFVEDSVGRSVSNLSDVETALKELYRRYGSRDSDP